jgi:SPP1 gp7 family putative phage head morphogenesis protein
MTANEQFLDAMIRHQIFLMRLSGKVRNDIFTLLEATEADMRAEILRRLKNIGDGGLTPGNVRKMNALIKVLKAMRQQAWKQAEQVWIDEMLDLAKSEPAFVAGLTKTVAPVTLSLDLPTARQLRAIVTSRPFEGRTMRTWAKTLAATDLRRIEDAIKIGLVQNQTNAQIARRVGAAANISKNNAAAITRTAVNHVANQAKQDFFKANPLTFAKELYVATLDANTTAICQSLDGKIFETGKGRIPPVHFNCRSIRVAILNNEILGNRPMKPVTEQMLLREFTKKEGIPGVTSRGALPRGYRTAFDKFGRQRTRELVGTVPASVNYQTFLTRQSASFQDDVLGRTKGQLFRRGGLTVDNFVNRVGDELTLSQLARRHADAFNAAGLDPEDFL